MDPARARRRKHAVAVQAVDAFLCGCRPWPRGTVHRQRRRDGEDAFDEGDRVMDLVCRKVERRCGVGVMMRAVFVEMWLGAFKNSFSVTKDNRTVVPLQ